MTHKAPPPPPRYKGKSVFHSFIHEATTQIVVCHNFRIRWKNHRKRHETNYEEISHIKTYSQTCRSPDTTLAGDSAVSGLFNEMNGIQHVTAWIGLGGASLFPVVDSHLRAFCQKNWHTLCSHIVIHKHKPYTGRQQENILH